MEQPRPRDAAEGGSGPPSAAWNGTCGRAGTAPGPGDDEEDGGGGGDPGTRCGCRGPPAPAPTPAGEPRAGACGLGCRHRGPPDGDGRARRARRRPRHRGALRENEEDEEEEEGGGLRGWGRGSLRAARAGAGLCLRLLGALLALLLLLLLLLLGGLRLCWRGLAAGAHRARELLGDPRQWLRGRRSPPGVPAAGEEELGRLLALAEVPEEELNPFQVLGVEPSAADAELRKAYRRLAVLVHPDKSPHPRAEEAFKVLRAGWDREEAGPERAGQVGGSLPEPAAGGPEGGHERHGLQPLRGPPQAVRAGQGPPACPVLRRVRGAAPGRGGGPVGRVPPAGAQDHLHGPHGRPGLRHHRVGWVPACGHLPGHPPCPLPPVLRRQGGPPAREAADHPQGQPPHPLGAPGFPHPHLSGPGGPWGALPAAPHPPRGRSPARGSPQARGGCPQGGHEAQEEEEGAAAAPTLRGPRSPQRASLNKKSIFLFFFFLEKKVRVF
ncbi:dnaJ homolog subfamily C member 14 isoform X1 [Pseudopipra pipra]|uniref:dnaJ homolog subfamily C member 14 isoform X1 n=1 Tax=Pseudopipra pipra TaxID=415032 RepID=UPI003138CCC4